MEDLKGIELNLFCMQGDVHESELLSDLHELATLSDAITDRLKAGGHGRLNYATGMLVIATEENIRAIRDTDPLARSMKESGFLPQWRKVMAGAGSG